MSSLEWFAAVLTREMAPWITLSDEQIADLYAHYELLERWNKRINLTSVEPGEEMVLRHYCESLFFAEQLPLSAGSVADLGSGAGFPGVPMAILRPEWKVTLVESNQRKAVFLREAGRFRANFSVMARRAEDLDSNFEWIVARAVNPQDMVALIPRLGRRIGLMMSSTSFPDLQRSKHVAWSEPIQLPWGDHRICVFGECST